MPMYCNDIDSIVEYLRGCKYRVAGRGWHGVLKHESVIEGIESAVNLARQLYDKDCIENVTVCNLDATTDYHYLVWWNGNYMRFYNEI